MKPLTEQQIRAIVQDEIRKNYTSGNPDIPPHSHNGTDGLNVDPHDLIGFTNMPCTPTKYLNISTGLNEFGFASSQQLAGGDSLLGGHPSQYVVDTTLAMYPIPIVVGNAGISQQNFEGGYAPEGTMVAFMGTINRALFVRFDGQWYGAPLSVII